MHVSATYNNKTNHDIHFCPLYLEFKLHEFSFIASSQVNVDKFHNHNNWICSQIIRKSIPNTAKMFVCVWVRKPLWMLTWTVSTNTYILSGRLWATVDNNTGDTRNANSREKNYLDLFPLFSFTMSTENWLFLYVLKESWFVLIKSFFPVASLEIQSLASKLLQNINK